jgi:thiol-disulfide isomerase/thioredoxin
MYRLLIFCLVAIQQPFIAHATDNSYSCEAPDQIQIEINRVNPYSIETLLEKYPDDFWIQRAYIDFMLKERTPPPRLGNGIPNGKVRESVIERFRKDYENEPDNPQSAYLYAYTLIHTDTQKSIDILTDITQKTPSFPTAYLTLSILHGYANFRDQQKQLNYTEAFLARCPDTLESRIASNAVQLDKSDALVAYVKALRKHLREKADAQVITLYPNLWRLEEKIALPSEQAELKKRIEGDLKFLEGLDDTVNATKVFILSQGYERIGDTAAIEKLGKQNPLYNSTVNLTSFYKARTEWARSNRPPAPNADKETRASYFRKQVQFLDQWMDRLPENPNLLSDRFKALASIPDTPNDVLVEEGEQVLAAIGRSSGGLINPAMEVLQTWSQRDIQIERIPSLVREFMKMPTQPTFMAAREQDSDLGNSSQLTLMSENNRWSANIIGWSILVTVHSKKQEFDLAREALGEWEKGLEERQKTADEITSRKKSTSGNTPASKPSVRNINIEEMLENSIVSSIPRDKAKYYEACAQVATAEKRSLDALTFYQSSLRLMYGRSMPPDVTVLDAGKAADNLWKELGGSEAGWKAWLESIRTAPTSPGPQNVLRWSASNRAIPDFSLSDQHDKTWTLASLKGKTTLINVWATWCGPCRVEHPYLQKLYERIKDRDDIQLITLNIDEDRSLVEPYLKENNLSFPSIYANSFVKEFAGSIGIPTSWISDSTGTIRYETLGFGGDGEQWLEQTLKQIESVGESE